MSFLDILFTVYFVAHIIPSSLFAPQIVLPHELRNSLVPSALRNLLESGFAAMTDPFLAVALPGAEREPWIVAITCCEYFLQLPFFVFAIACLTMKWRDTFRLPAIIYASHVITTLIPIFAELLYGRKHLIAPETAEFSIRLKWIGIYAPFLVIPALLLIQQTLFFEPYDKPVAAKKLPSK
eukprot:jgi/Hompol1/3937/HPOL_001530-RA